MLSSRCREAERKGRWKDGKIFAQIKRMGGSAGFSAVLGYLPCRRRGGPVRDWRFSYPRPGAGAGRPAAWRRGAVARGGQLPVSAVRDSKASFNLVLLPVVCRGAGAGRKPFLAPADSRAGGGSHAVDLGGAGFVHHHCSGMDFVVYVFFFRRGQKGFGAAFGGRNPISRPIPYLPSAPAA